MSLQKIENLCGKHAEAVTALANKIAKVDAAILKIANAAQAEVAVLVKAVTKSEKALSKLLEANPELFEKPRTQTFSGIKVGFNKSKDTIEIEDTDKTCALIKKHFPEMEGTLIKCSEAPVNSALLNLQPGQLKKVGAKKIDGKDQMVLKPADSNLAKIVSAQIAAANTK